VKYAIVVVAILLTLSCRVRQQSSVKEAWDDQNSPELLGLQSLKLADLSQPDALAGGLATPPWSDTYWPLNQAGLANRWQEGGTSFSIAASDPEYRRKMNEAIAARIEEAKARDASRDRQAFTCRKV